MRSFRPDGVEVTSVTSIKDSTIAEKSLEQR